jgi:hypothetical protein
MIVKTTRWKQTNIEYLINYINNDKGVATENKQIFSVFHNICQPNLKNAIEAFKSNDVYRKKRKQGVVFYHEILSFHNNDKEDLTIDKMENMAYKYIEVRGNNAICFAKPHLDKDNFHIHFCFSGTEYKSQKTLRMDNKTFKQVRLAIERYQMENFPELSNSIVYHKSKEKTLNKTKDKEYQQKKRTHKATDKDQVIDILKDHYNIAKSYDEFCHNLSENKFELYYYRDKVSGIFFNKRKYRFNTLGFGADKFALRLQTVEQFTQVQPFMLFPYIEKHANERILGQEGIHEFTQDLEQIQKSQKQKRFFNRLKDLQNDIRQKINNRINRLSTRIKTRLLGMNR